MMVREVEPALDVAGVAEGSFVHRWVPGAGPRTLLLLHGTGGSESDLLPLGREIDPQAALLGVRGRVLENGMARFFRRLREGVFDENDIRRQAAALAGFVEGAARERGFSLDTLYAVGFSNGANMAAALMLLHPTLLRGAVLLRPMLPLTPAEPPALFGRRALISAGESDEITPCEEPARLADVLAQAGADVTLRWEPAGHRLGQGDVPAARRWLIGE